MVKVFIAGATGYIGLEVALALRREGHDVYALVRSSSSAAAKVLAENEIRIVEGDLKKPETFIAVASNASVLIHAAADYSDFVGIDNLATDAFLKVAESSQSNSDRKLLIYTSGVLVYPDSLQIADEDTQLDTNPFLAGRRANEQRFLNATKGDGVVIRPSFVYGKKNVDVFYKYFEQAGKGEVFTTSKLTDGWTHIHIDDVAAAYVKIIESSRAVVRGQIFNVGDDSRTTNEQVAKVFSGIAGYTGAITGKPEQGWPVANKNVYVTSRKLTRLTGWYPKHIALLDEVDIYYNHWKVLAAKKAEESK